MRRRGKNDRETNSGRETMEAEASVYKQNITVISWRGRESALAAPFRPP